VVDVRAVPRRGVRRRRRRGRAVRGGVLQAMTIVTLSALGAACSEAEFQRVEPTPTFLDDKVAVEGALCTRSPESLVFPLRVLFVVDASESMRVTDPPDPVTGLTRREQTVRAVWSSLLAQGLEDVRVGILRFSAEAQSRTPVDLDGDAIADSWFSIDPIQLDVATAALASTDRTTNFAAALAEAQFEIRAELARADLESLPLSKYVVVFVSDGIPDVDPTDDQGNGADQILTAVRQLVELTQVFRVGSFALHTVYLSAGQGPALDKPAQDLLQRMADVGQGSYRSVPNGEAVNVVDIDFSVIRRVFTLKTLAVTNLNVAMDAAQVAYITAESIALEERLDYAQIDAGFTDTSGDGFLQCGEPLVDTDGDGLADLAERLAGTSPFLPDSDDDGLSDRHEWDLRPARDPTDRDDAGCHRPSPCAPDDADPDLCACVLDADADGVCDCASGTSLTPCADPVLGRDCVDRDEDGDCDCPDADGDGFCDYADRDGDGLTDCAEVYLGSAKNGVDSDGDGLPDPIEARVRTSPVSLDVAGDYDFDRTDNFKEARGGTDPLCNDAALRSRLAYRYTLTETGLVGDRTCYTFRVGNITLAPTLPNPSAEAYPPAPREDADGEPIPEETPIASPVGRLGDGRNRILVWAGEVAFDDPDAYARFRVACVEPRFAQPGNFKNPPSGKLRITEDDFVDVRDFDPLRDCRRP